MASALSVTTWADFKHLGPTPLWFLELMALLGMVGALLWLALRSVPDGAMARVVVWGYAVLLLSLGGWMSLIVLIDTPRQLPLDGEFLDESNARIAAIGIWLLLCLLACWRVRPRREQEPRPAAILTDERHEPA